MTSPIPNYSSTVEIGKIEAADIHHHNSAISDLIGFVDPATGHSFPPGHRMVLFLNTNYILAGLIIEAASGMNYEQALTTMDSAALGLRRYFLRRRTASGVRAAAGPQHVACASRALPAAGLPRLPAGALQRINARAAHRQRHADAKHVLGWTRGSDSLDAPRSRPMDLRPVRETGHSRDATRRDDDAHASQKTGSPLR